MRPLALFLIVILLAIPACLQAPGLPTDESDAAGDPSARAQTGGSPDTPTWTVNDHWVLRTYPQDDPDADGAVIDLFVQAIDILHADGADMDAFRVVSQQANRTTWYRMSDLALMKEQTVDQEGVHDTVYERPCALYQWPLAVDATWSQTCTRTEDGNTISLNFTAVVEAEEMLSVPTGNFSTFRIQYTGTEGSTPFERTEYFAPNACIAIRTITPGATHTEVRDLIAYQCTAMS